MRLKVQKKHFGLFCGRESNLITKSYEYVFHKADWFLETGKTPFELLLRLSTCIM